jgi:hypothetical protein
MLDDKFYILYYQKWIIRILNDGMNEWMNEWMYRRHHDWHLNSGKQHSYVFQSAEHVLGHGRGQMGCGGIIL